MNTILNLFKPEGVSLTIKETQDPVPSFIDKLSAGEDLKIKIQRFYLTVAKKKKSNHQPKRNHHPSRRLSLNR